LNSSSFAGYRLPRIGITRFAGSVA
jgi:hypothetical protein